MIKFKVGDRVKVNAFGIERWYRNSGNPLYKEGDVGTVVQRPMGLDVQFDRPHVRDWPGWMNEEAMGKAFVKISKPTIFVGDMS